MNSKTLTHQEALLLQRYVDDEAVDKQRADAEALLEESPPARVYLAALKALRKAMQLAEEEIWRRAALPSPEKWAELAESSADLVDMQMDDLAPLLERFHDGEVDDTEAAVVAALVDERPDVAEYLSELDRLSAGIQQAGSVDDVDFGGFWDSIEEEIADDNVSSTAPVLVESFDSREHRLLLYRYHDGQCTADERRQVDTWIEAGNQEVDDILGALAEVHVGINAGIEVAGEDADLDQIWTSLGDRLDVVDAERIAENVVAFDAAPESKPAPESSWNRPFLAVAAAVVLLTAGALIGPQILQSQDELVETRTIVIFDNYESAPGSSVEIIGPEWAGYENNGGHPGIQSAEDDAQPTVLWLIDDEDKSDDDDEESEEETEELPGPI